MVGIERGVGRETKKEKRKKRMSECVRPIIPAFMPILALII